MYYELINLRNCYFLNKLIFKDYKQTHPTSISLLTNFLFTPFFMAFFILLSVNLFNLH